MSYIIFFLSPSADSWCLCDISIPTQVFPISKARRKLLFEKLRLSIQLFQLVSLILNKSCILSLLTSQLQLQITCERKVLQSNFQRQKRCNSTKSKVADISKNKNKNVSVLLTRTWLKSTEFWFHAQAQRRKLLCQHHVSIKTGLQGKSSGTQGSQN